MHSSSPHSCYMPCPSHPPWLDDSNYTWRRVQFMKLLIMQFSSTSCHFIFLLLKLRRSSKLMLGLTQKNSKIWISGWKCGKLDKSCICSLRHISLTTDYYCKKGVHIRLHLVITNTKTAETERTGFWWPIRILIWTQKILKKVSLTQARCRKRIRPPLFPFHALSIWLFAVIQSRGAL
jgi:hypothetical protein